MSHLDEIHLGPESLERFAPLLGAERVRAAAREGDALREALGARAVWNVNSTAIGGGVAELLRALLPYARGAGIDARWVVIRGSPAFFKVTKRLHNAFHGEPGDGSALDDAAGEVYAATTRANAEELLARVQPGDFVILHDPQTAGLATPLRAAGARVIWRCHVGAEAPNAESARAWAFVAPYLRGAEAHVFTRAAYIPPDLPRDRCVVIAPSIDPFAPKNQAMDDATARAILAHVGVLDGPAGDAPPTFRREDGSPGRVDRYADVIGLGPAPAWDAPLVVQVSRWDHLKDPLGVVAGFAQLVETGAHPDARLVLAGPNVNAVADDPDGARVFAQVLAGWRALPHHARRAVRLVNLPMGDVEENAAIVNALQRHASVVVQKSLREGFGLTVTEAMWKARPVVASAVGGIQDQITDGVDGVLLRDPTDVGALADAVHRLLAAPETARRLGQRAHERVRDHFLGVRHLRQYAALLRRLAGAPSAAP